jgi:predicted transposase YbfD/YdcC
MVNAWASHNRLVLGQLKTEDKSNEMTALPRLLDVLALSGCIVTMDAMHCQKETLAAVVDKDHGRIEVRRCWTTSRVEMLVQEKGWAGLSSVGMVESERHLEGRVETERRFFLSSLPGDNAAKFLSTVRTHWSVENQLHWSLDVAFREDDARMRKDNAPENAAVLRQIALDLLKRGAHIRYDDGKVKKAPGIKARRKMAGWDHDWLLHLLGLQTPRSPMGPTALPV